jgi:transcriptional regulator with XRE-family HTH domain
MRVTTTLALPGQGVSELRRRRELANFLRARRERLSPTKLGLPLRQRRRVEGLRRDEVAELAGISASWYTWLEQGREIRVSAETLGRLAEALQLQQDEREQLFILSQLPPPRLAHSDKSAPEGIRDLLDKFDPWPAIALCARWDVVEWNHGAVRLFGDFAVTPIGKRNFLWLLLTHPSFRALFAESDRMIRCVTSHFRAAFNERLSDRGWADLVAALERQSEEFRLIWREYGVLRPPDWRKVMNHPELGRLQFDPITLEHPPDHQIRVIFYRPADVRTEAEFRR